MKKQKNEKIKYNESHWYEEVAKIIKQEIAQLENKHLTITQLSNMIGKPVFVIVDDRKWWDIVKGVYYSDINQTENNCYISLTIFGDAHYKTFNFFEKE